MKFLLLLLGLFIIQVSTTTDSAPQTEQTNTESYNTGLAAASGRTIGDGDDGEDDGEDGEDDEEESGDEEDNADAKSLPLVTEVDDGEESEDSEEEIVPEVLVDSSGRELSHDESDDEKDIFIDLGDGDYDERSVEHEDEDFEGYDYEREFDHDDLEYDDE